jgi:CheY-like chemotaxis protein
MTRGPIIVATDNAADRQLLLDVLSSFSTHDSAITAVDCAEAELVLRDTERPPPSLVLLDEDLPGTSCADVLTMLRNDPRLKRTPVIVLTGRSSGHASGAYEAGANSVIRRPSSRPQFTEALHHVIRYWLFLNQSP